MKRIAAAFALAVAAAFALAPAVSSASAKATHPAQAPTQQHHCSLSTGAGV